MSTNTTISRRSEIKVAVELNEQKQPIGLQWHAEDAGLQGEKAAKAMMLALWDKNDQSTMRIDLWTKDMMVDEMADFYYQMLMSMADTFKRATQQEEMGEDMKKFAKGFFEKFKAIQLKEGQ